MQGKANTIVVLCLIALSVVTLAYQLGSQPLMDVDEASYAEIARNMYNSGDWVIPRLHDGKPSFLKPPLYYWSVAVSYHVFGTGEFAVRFVSLFYGIACMLLTWWIARRLTKEPSVLLAPLLLALSPGFFVMVRSSTTDMTLTCMVTLSLYGFVRGWMNEDQHPDLLATVALWGGAGLGTLSKGPIGIGIPFSIIFLYFLATGQWRRFFRLRWLVGLPLWAAIVFPWYILCTLQEGISFLEKNLLYHNLQKFLQSGLYDAKPGYTFLFNNFLWMFFPWVVPYLVGFGFALWNRFRNKIRFTHAEIFLILWFWFPLMIFSFSKFKLPTYIDPGLPSCAIFTAILLGRWFTGASPKPVRISLKVILPLTAAAVCIALIAGLGLFFPHPVKLVRWLPLLSLPFLVWFTLRLIRIGNKFHALVLVTLLLLLNSSFLVGYLHPRIMQYAPYKTIGNLIRSEYAADGPIAVFQTGIPASLRFYSDGSYLYVMETDVLRKHMARPGALVLTEKRRLVTLPIEMQNSLREIDRWSWYHVAKMNAEFLFHETRESKLITLLLLEVMEPGQVQAEQPSK